MVRPFVCTRDAPLGFGFFFCFILFIFLSRWVLTFFLQGPEWKLGGEGKGVMKSITWPSGSTPRNLSSQLQFGVGVGAVIISQEVFPFAF